MLNDYEHRFNLYLICLVATLIIILLLGILIPSKLDGKAYIEIVTIDELFLSAPRSSASPDDIVLYGILIEDVVLYKIIECESKFKPDVCNQKYGCSSGIGLGQLTSVAIDDCENNLGREIDPYNPQENLICVSWLYEKYGTAPWGTSETDWGSYHCWKKVALIN